MENIAVSEKVLENVVSVVSTGGNYANVTLVERHFNINDMDEATFIKSLQEDMNMANARYDKIMKIGIEDSHDATTADLLKRHRSKLESFVEAKKYKRPQTGEKYIAKGMAEYEAELKTKYEKAINTTYSIGFADFKPNYMSNSIPASCVVSNLSYEALCSCYTTTMLENIYWENAIGWRIVYEANMPSMRSAFRPHIELILCEGHENDMKNDADLLYRAMDNFYKNSKYFGD